jgi:hypothetical protein
MSQPSTPSAPQPDRPHLVVWVQYGWNRIRPALVLGLVPALATLLDVGRVLRVVAARGRFDVGVSLQFPAPIADLWTFTQLDAAGGVDPASLLLLPVAVIVEGLLAAGYLGSIDDVLAGRPFEFGANVTRYGLRMILYTALWTVVTGGLLLVFAALSPVLVLVLGIPVILVVTYLLYGTPYLLVVRDAPLAAALSRSVDYASNGGPYFRYGIGYLFGTAALSILSTLFVVNLGIIGLLLGVGLAATLGLALNTATVGVVRALDAGRFGRPQPGDSPPNGPGQDD